MHATDSPSNPAPTRVLLAVAAPAELAAVGRGLGVDLAPTPWTLLAAGSRADCVLTGVSKANAAGAVARVLDPAVHLGVLSIGVAGALPGSDMSIGDVVLAQASVFADEGVTTPTGFETCASMGFAPGPIDGMNALPTADWLAALRPIADRVAPIATVSACSGTDGAAADVASRTAAAAEAMEGAAVGLAAARIAQTTGRPLAFAELRVISNTTGDRDRQTWDLPRALDRLAAVLGPVIEALGRR